MSEPMTDAELAAIEDDARTNDIPDYEAQVYVRELLAEVRRLRAQVEHHRNDYRECAEQRLKVQEENERLRARLALYEPPREKMTPWDKGLVCADCGELVEITQNPFGQGMAYRCRQGHSAIATEFWRYELAERIKRGEVAR